MENNVKTRQLQHDFAFLTKEEVETAISIVEAKTSLVETVMETTRLFINSCLTNRILMN